MNALVVDSSSTMRSVLSRILTMRGFEVTEAADVQRALALLDGSRPPDIAMVQWGIHDMCPLALVAHLRNEPPNRTITIMLAEAEPGMRELQQVLFAGADDYLVKPFTSRQIDGKLDHANLARRWAGHADRRAAECR